MAVPSNADRAVTEEIYQAFSLVGINLVEHLVFSENGFFPILKRFRLDPQYAANHSQFNCKIDERFYDVDEDEFSFSELFKDE